jgi:hypothetical protein
MNSLLINVGHVLPNAHVIGRKQIHVRKARWAPRAGTPSRSGVDTRGAVLTFEDVRDRAKADHDVRLVLSTVGPYFKLSCLRDQTGGGGQVLLGETEGLVLSPLRILHVDSMRIYNSRMKTLKRSGEETGQLGMMGLGTCRGLSGDERPVFMF